MNLSSSTVRLGPLRLSSTAAGAACCVVSMLAYSTTNACMKQLSTMPSVPAWAVCVKESITVLVVGPWLLWQMWRKKTSFPRGRTLVMLVTVGLATELIGNMGVQWGYEIVGLAVMVPAYTGFILVAATVLSGVLLGERVSGQNLAAVGLLIVAATLLGIGSAHAAGATEATSAAKASAGPWLTAAAIGAAAAAGIVFAFLGIAIRHCVTGSTSYSAVMVVITGMGVLSLAPLSFYSAGAARLLSTPWPQYVFMFAGGVCNLIAFFALVRGLQLTTVLHVNMINAGQVATAALAGMLFFGEKFNYWLVAGVCLMIVGILAFGSPVDQEAIDAHV